ncbi:MAG: hypothetical protein IPG42_20910 [Betaproteobacteria bacterium]|nr:hypothetical protein [Betaproteobacteria bacterium]
MFKLIILSWPTLLGLAFILALLGAVKLGFWVALAGCVVAYCGLFASR